MQHTNLHPEHISFVYDFFLLRSHSSRDHTEHMLAFFVMANVINCSPNPCLINFKTITVTHDRLVFSTDKNRHIAMRLCGGQQCIHHVNKVQFYTELAYLTFVMGVY